VVIPITIPLFYSWDNLSPAILSLVRIGVRKEKKKMFPGVKELKIHVEEMEYKGIVGPA
jgi:hypothetical protein